MWFSRAATESSRPTRTRSNTVEVGGQGPEAERAGGNELAHRRRIDGQDLPDHRHRVVRGGHGQLVHEVDGDVHAGVGITV